MNSHSNIQAQLRKGETFADMWKRCKDTKWELAALQNIATATKDETDSDLREVHICAYDAAYSSESQDERDGFIEAMEDVFMQWAADEAFHEACVFYEARTGKDCDSSPTLFDPDTWKREWIAEGAR